MNDTENVQYLINEKGIRHFKLESDLYGILDVVSYEEYKNLQQKVEQLVKENILLKEANNYHQEVIKSMKEPENVHHYHLENIKLRKRNRLNNIINELKEYIEKHQYKWYDLNGEEYIEPTRFDEKVNPSVLLKILQELKESD